MLFDGGAPATASHRLVGLESFRWVGCARVRAGGQTCGLARQTGNLAHTVRTNMIQRSGLGQPSPPGSVGRAAEHHEHAHPRLHASAPRARTPSMLRQWQSGRVACGSSPPRGLQRAPPQPLSEEPASQCASRCPARTPHHSTPASLVTPLCLLLLLQIQHQPQPPQLRAVAVEPGPLGLCARLLRAQRPACARTHRVLWGEG